MNINDFVSIMVVGAALSVLVQGLKTVFSTKPGVTRALTIVIAIIFGGGYVWLRSTPYFETTVLVLTTASAVYALIMKPLES